MEFHVITKAAKANPKTPEEETDKTIHILSTEHKSGSDTSPLQFISTEALARYKRIEAAARALTEAIAEES